MKVLQCYSLQMYLTTHVCEQVQKTSGKCFNIS